MSRRKDLPGLMGPALVLGAFAALVIAERRRPLRRRVEHDGRRRFARNLAMAGLTATVLQVAERPIVRPLARVVEERRLGLLPALRLPSALETVFALLLMDYTLYLWHVLTHRVSLLWRFHLVHHADLDLDASTALRFHFGEFVASVPWRVAQILLIGVSPGALVLWQRLTLAEVLFHHSNLKLPIGVERWLVRWIVTPRMHGIHHSTAREETEASWSSGLTLWDRLHGTLRLNVPQNAVTIGVPAYRARDEVTLPKLVTMPFGRQRPAWDLTGDGRPRRAPAPIPASTMAP